MPPCGDRNKKPKEFPGTTRIRLPSAPLS
jgi:hypothetical protein